MQYFLKICCFVTQARSDNEWQVVNCMLIHSLPHLEMLAFICYAHKYMDGHSNTITTVARTGGGYGIGAVQDR